MRLLHLVSTTVSSGEVETEIKLDVEIGMDITFVLVIYFISKLHG